MKAPEFWFDKDGKLWLAHECGDEDGTFTREYTLPECLYEVEHRDPLTVRQVITCTLCDLRGRLVDGAWEALEPRSRFE